MNFEWIGIFPALTTKFTINDELDLPLFHKNLDAQIKAGVNGVVLGGTLGEASVLTDNEKEQLVKYTIEKAEGKIPVILNIAEGATSEALKKVSQAKKWGADGLMLLPPMRYKTDHRETVAYFKTIADSTSLPIMIYNNPVDYKTEVTLEMFDELKQCANITAVKESTRDVTNVTRMKNHFGDRFKILCGVDTLAMEVGRSLQFFYTSSNYTTVDHILLAGGCSVIHGLDEAVSSRTQVASTMRANPFFSMATGKVRGKQIQLDAPSLLIACGLAMRRFDPV